MTPVGSARRNGLFIRSPRRVGEQRRRHDETERLCSLEVDDQLELGWQQHRQVGWFLALENATDINTKLPIGIRQVRAVADQASGLGVISCRYITGTA